MLRTRTWGLVAALAASIFLCPTAHADNPAVNTTTTDNYAYLTGAGGEGFESASTSAYLVGNSNITVEAWVNPSDTMTSSTGIIFIRQDLLEYYITNGTYGFVYNNAGWKTAIDTGVRARINEWQHVAFVKSGTTFSLYLNGSLAYQLVDATNIPATLNNSSQYVAIGASMWNGSANVNYPTSSYFAGGIDEVRVWTTARSQSDIANNMNVKVAPSTSGLASYWDFNGTSDTTKIYDRTGLLNLVTWGTPAPTYPDIKTTVTTPGAMTVTFPRTYLNGTGGYQIPTGFSTVSTLIVGGGGAGGFDGGGGGGGGGVYQNNALAVTPGSSVTVIVGAGGAAVNGYTGGSLACNNVWSNTVVACVGSAGGSSKFDATTASGGGGGGGIEASGSNDSDATANARGGGGGAGGQNSRSGGNSPGAGAFNGGSVADVSSSGGGGGASGSAAGSIGTTSAAGNGAAGISATLNSTIYGSGGAGGTFSSATLATGGTGAANGGTTTLAPTTPLPNRGGGGAGGGNGSPTLTNAYGTTGAAGIVIIRYSLVGSATLSFSTAPAFRTLSPIAAATSSAGKVTFYANGKRIPGCIQISTISLVATCNWKPSVHAPATSTAQFTPSDSNYLSSSSSIISVRPSNRVGNR
jgi:hypothetical protein